MRVLLVIILSSSICVAQKKIATVDIAHAIAYAAVDRPGDLYIIMRNGDAIKLDKSGIQIGKKKFPSLPTIFDPKDGTRAFAYYRETQTIESIAPDLSFADDTPLHPEFAVSAWLVCPSKNEFWILDSADSTLKKTKGKGTAIAYETRFGKSGSQYMREYLNFLFVLDNGIHILNNLGKEIRTLDVKVPYFNFLGEEIYYPSGNSLQLVDLYTTEKKRNSTAASREIRFPHRRPDDIGEYKSIEFFEFKP